MNYTQLFEAFKASSIVRWQGKDALIVEIE